MIRGDSFAPGRLGIVTRTLCAEFTQVREAIGRCSNGLPDNTALRQVGARLRRVTGVLEMVGAPVQARFLLEFAEIALSGASSDAKAAAVAAGCLGAAVSELGTGTATTHPLLQELQEERPDSDDAETLLRHGHEAYQRGLLGWLRDGSTGIESMHQGLARVARLRPAPHRSLWRLAAIFIECLRLSIIPGDVSTKKLCARIEQQLRRLRSGSLAGDAPLLCDILALIAMPPTGSARLREVIVPFGLGSLLSITAEQLAAGAIPAPGRGELREALRAGKSAWAEFCEGRSEALAEFREQITRAAQNTHSLGNVQGLLQAICACASTPRSPAMAGWTVEIAGALLAAENASELSRIGPSIAAGIEALTTRLSAEPHAADGMVVSPMFWLSDSTAPAAHEVLARIKHAEQVLAEFLVDRSKAGELHALGLSLSACSAVLRMLGLDRAADLAIKIHGQVTELAQPDLPLTEERTWRAAEAICSLELYCRTLVERCGNADFQRLDLLGLRDTEAPITGAGVPKRKELPFANAPAEGESQAPPTASVRVADEADELLAVFIEESDEIVAALSQHVQRCRETLSDHAALTEIRRGFHTLKGSSRMIGLTALSASAWALEDMLNSWLELHRPTTPALLDLLVLAQQRFAKWTGALKRDGCVDADNAELLAGAARMKGSDLCALVAATATPAIISDIVEPDIDIGSAAVPAALFAIFQREAAEHHRRLMGQVDNLSKHSEAALDAEFVRPAHTLASISRAVGLPYLADLAHALEQWLDTLIRQSKHLDEPARVLMHKALALVGDMLDALRQRQAPSGEIVSQGAAVSGAIVSLVEAMTAKSPTGNAAGGSVVCNTTTDPAPLMPGRPVASPVAAMHGNEGADAELLSVFVEEGGECIAAIGAGLRAWRADPSEREAPQALRRVLHNFKGSAHTAGVMDIGDLVHHLEGRVEALTGAPPASEFDDLEHRFDVVAVAIERLRADLDRRRDVPGNAPPTAVPAGLTSTMRPRVQAPPSASGDSLLRVRVYMVERLLNQAGEISIARSLVEAEMAQLKRGFEDLLGVLTRLREQQHDIEIQTESQIHSRLPQRQASTDGFDPLELDRYTRVQEIARMMAESISDSRILHQHLDQSIERIGAALAEQGRITRQHHQDLMCVRALALRSVADRLYRVVRQAAREVGKDAGLVIHGEHLEFDRALLDQLVAPLEHLLRNAVVHGIESPAVRVRAGKPEHGKVVLTVRQAPPGIVITVSDDGAGLDPARLRAKAVEKGLIGQGAPLSDEEAMHLIFSPGFSTAEVVTGLAGRGVGMDAVLDAITAAGGRIEVRSEAGAGACFSLFLPVTHGIVHAVLVRAGSALYAIPSAMFEQVLEAQAEHREGNEHRRPFVHASREYPAVHYLPRLLGDSACVTSVMRQQKLLLLHEGGAHAAVLVDEVIGNREVIIKGVGPQLSGVPGILGATALGDGRSVLILNPVQLAHRNEAAIAAQRAADSARARAPGAPLVMVVDDSLTVRKFTERLLSRYGYEVTTARDGMDAMEQMAVSLPDVILLDIEMPRMDGFDLARKLKQSPRTAHVPLIMITSRAAEKHRRHALGLGVDAFLGKPYVEQQLLDQIAGFVQRPAA
ncbi:MAG: Hpt domain-containing protein [Pseudomonadota bacterium]|nr:Hpt domain-containing protein [Pseudomonadota bacterium]